MIGNSTSSAATPLQKEKKTTQGLIAGLIAEPLRVPVEGPNGFWTVLLTRTGTTEEAEFA